MLIESSKFSKGYRTGLPSETEIMSTPSAIASSNPARMSASLQPIDDQHTAMRVDETPPRDQRS